MKKYLITFKTNSFIVICCDEILEKNLIGLGYVTIFFKLNGVTIGNVEKKDILSIEEI